MAYEPAAAKDSPRAYYLFLRSQGIPPLQAVQKVEERFGPPKTDKEKAKDAQMNSLMQMGGNIGGLLLTSEIMRGFPNLGGLFGSGGGAGAGAVEMPTALGGTEALGGSTAGGAGSASGSSLSAAGSYALPAIAAAITLNNMYETGGKDILRGKGDRADWTNQAVNNAPLLSMLLGSGGFLPIAAALPLANIGLRLMGKKSIGHYMTTGKSDAQLNRDDFRGVLKESGIVDDNYQITLADGSKFNIGLDGKTKYTNTDGKTTRNAWDVDFSNPLAKFATDQIDPIIRGMYANPPKGVNPEQYTGMLVNAVTSNAKSEADVRANIARIINNGKLQGATTPVAAKPAAVTPPATTPPPAPQQNQVKGPAPISQPPTTIPPTGNMSIRDLLDLYMRK